VSIASYQVVETERGEKFAQYLVVYGRGSRTVGVWKRYSEFERLAAKIGAVEGGRGGTNSTGTGGRRGRNRSLRVECFRRRGGEKGGYDGGGGDDYDSCPSSEEEDLFSVNAVTSWTLIQKRRKWFKCLRSDYLSLKAWLLERFLHDVLFESPDGDVVKDFVAGKL